MRLLNREQIRNLGLKSFFTKRLIDSITPAKVVEKLNHNGVPIKEAYYSLESINEFIGNELGYNINFISFERGSWANEIVHIIKHFGKIKFKDIVFCIRFLLIRRYFFRKEIFKKDLWSKEFLLDVKFTLDQLNKCGNILYNTKTGEYVFKKEPENFQETPFTYKLLKHIDSLSDRNRHLALLVLNLIIPVPESLLWYARKKLGGIKKSEILIFALSGNFRVEFFKNENIIPTKEDPNK